MIQMKPIYLGGPPYINHIRTIRCGQNSTHQKAAFPGAATLVLPLLDPGSWTQREVRKPGLDFFWGVFIHVVFWMVISVISSYF